MGNRIVICHWDNGGHWESIEIATSGLNGHDNHELDIWPPVDGVTDGMNWPVGEAVYLNGCVIQTTPTPSPTETTASPSPTEPSPTNTATGTPSPSPTLPETGAGENAIMGVAAIAMIAVGIWTKRKSMNR